MNTMFVDSVALRQSGDALIGIPLALRARGRASVLCKMILDVVHEVAHVDRVHTPLVIGSALGEMETTHALLEQIFSEDSASPLRFQNSVHNTACGLWSMACGQTAPSMAIAAGHDTLAMALLEAYGYLYEYGGKILVAVGDEAASGVLYGANTWDAMAAGFLVTLEKTDKCMATIHMPQRVRDEDHAPNENPCAAAVDLALRIREHRSGDIHIGRWRMRVEFCDG